MSYIEKFYIFENNFNNSDLKVNLEIFLENKNFNFFEQFKDIDIINMLFVYIKHYSSQLNNEKLVLILNIIKNKVLNLNNDFDINFILEYQKLLIDIICNFNLNEIYKYLIPIFENFYKNYNLNNINLIQQVQLYIKNTNLTSINYIYCISLVRKYNYLKFNNFCLIDEILVNINIDYNNLLFLKLFYEISKIIYGIDNKYNTEKINFLYKENIQKIFYEINNFLNNNNNNLRTEQIKYILKTTINIYIVLNNFINIRGDDLDNIEKGYIDYNYINNVSIISQKFDNVHKIIINNYNNNSKNLYLKLELKVLLSLLIVNPLSSNFVLYNYQNIIITIYNEINEYEVSEDIDFYEKFQDSEFNYKDSDNLSICLKIIFDLNILIDNLPDILLSILKTKESENKEISFFRFLIILSKISKNKDNQKFFIESVIQKYLYLNNINLKNLILILLSNSVHFFCNKNQGDFEELVLFLFNRYLKDCSEDESENIFILFNNIFFNVNFIKKFNQSIFQFKSFFQIDININNIYYYRFLIEFFKYYKDKLLDYSVNILENIFKIIYKILDNKIIEKYSIIYYLFDIVIEIINEESIYESYYHNLEYIFLNLFNYIDYDNHNFENYILKIISILIENIKTENDLIKSLFTKYATCGIDCNLENNLDLYNCFLSYFSNFNYYFESKNYISLVYDSINFNKNNIKGFYLLIFYILFYFEENNYEVIKNTMENLEFYKNSNLVNYLYIIIIYKTNNFYNINKDDLINIIMDSNYDDSFLNEIKKIGIFILLNFEESEDNKKVFLSKFMDLISLKVELNNKEVNIIFKNEKILEKVKNYFNNYHYENKKLLYLHDNRIKNLKNISYFNSKSQTQEVELFKIRNI